MADSNSNRQSRDSSIRSSDGAADSSSARGDYTTELQRRYDEVLRERDSAELVSLKARADLEDALKRAETLKNERDQALAELSSIGRTGTDQPAAIFDNRELDGKQKCPPPGVETGVDISARPDSMEPHGMGLMRSNGGPTWASSNPRLGDMSASQLLQTDINATEGKITWETHVVNLVRNASHGIGIAITGGRDNPMCAEGEDNAIYISDIIKGGPSEGKLVIGDRVLSVNGVSFENIEHATAVLALRDGGTTVNIVVQRKVIISAKVDTEQPFKVTLTRKKKKEDFGISFGSRLYIRNIRPGSLSALQGDLREGDHIIRINNTPADTLSLTEVRKLFDKSSKDKISLIVSRGGKSAYPTPTSSSAVPSRHHSTEDVRVAVDDSEPRQNSTQAVQDQTPVRESKFDQDSMSRPQQTSSSQPPGQQHFPPQYTPNGSGPYEISDSTMESDIKYFNNPYRDNGINYTKLENEGWQDSVYNVRAYPSDSLRSSTKGGYPYESRDASKNVRNLNQPLDNARPIGYMEAENEGIHVPDYPRAQMRSEDSPRGYDGRGLRPTSELIARPELNRSFEARPQEWMGGRPGAGLPKSVGSPNIDHSVSFRGFVPEQDYVSGRVRPLNEDIVPFKRDPPPDREPRVVSFRKEGGVGIRISGGNRTGIFVAKVAPNTPAEMQGLCEGDLILKVNDTEMRGMTREEAVMLLLGLREQVTLVVQYCRPEYERLMAEGGTGDLFHIRTHFTYSITEHGEMPFQNGDIFQVTDSLYSGVVGSWQASLLRGHKSAKKGIIPNQSRAEQLALAQDSNNKENMSSPLNNSRPATRSSSGFFKKRTAWRAKSLGKDNWDDIVLGKKPGKSPTIKPGGRNSKFSAYERVVLRDPGFIRPVVIFGPLADVARQKLIQDLPEWFESPQTEGKADNEKNTRSGIIKLGAIRQIIDKRKHAVLDVTPSAVDRLNYSQYAPIVVYLRAESKQAVKELRQHWARHSSKSHRKLFEQSERLESLFNHLFTYTIPLTNGEAWYRKLKDAIDKAQKERIWMSEFKPTESIKDDVLFPLSHRLSFISSLESDAEMFQGGYVGGDYDPGTPLPETPLSRTPQQRGYYDLEDPRGGPVGGSLGWEGRGRLVRSSSDPSIATLDNIPINPSRPAYEQQNIVPVYNGSPGGAYDAYPSMKRIQSEDFVDHSSGRPVTNMVLIGREPISRDPPSIGRVQSEYGTRRPVYRSNGELPQYRSSIDPYATLTPSERVRLQQQQPQMDIRYNGRQQLEPHPGSVSYTNLYMDQFPTPPPQYPSSSMNGQPPQGRVYINPGPQYPMSSRPAPLLDQARSVPDLQMPIRNEHSQHQPIRIENPQHQQAIRGEYPQNQPIRAENGDLRMRMEADYYWRERNGRPEGENKYLNADAGPYYVDQQGMFVGQDDSLKFNSLKSSYTSDLNPSSRYDDPRSELRRGSSQFASAAGSIPYFSANDVRGNTLHQSIRNTSRPKTAEVGAGMSYDAALMSHTDQAGRSQINQVPGHNMYNQRDSDYIDLRAKSETNLAASSDPHLRGREFSLQREPAITTRAHYLYDRPYASMHQSTEVIHKTGNASSIPSSSSNSKPNVPPPKPPHLPESNLNGKKPATTNATRKTGDTVNDSSKASEIACQPDERRSSAFETYRKFFESNALQNGNGQKSSNKGNESSEGEDTHTVVATARGVFDCSGGILESKETGVSIIVPKGAIPENVRQEIYFKVCKDGSIVPPLDEKKGETLLSPLVMCGPHGLKFQKPVELRLPHSASINPESWSFALKSSESPVGQPTNWHNMSLADSEGVSQGKVSKNSVSVMVDHF